jgi:type I restriction enzyme S subunit
MKTLSRGWKLSTIGNECKIVKGKKPFNSGERSKERNVPYINIKAFESGEAEQYAESGNYPKCTEDDVLIVWDGARSGLIGRGVSGYIGSTLAKISAGSLHNRLLFYFLQSKYSDINSRTKGIGIPHVNPQVLESIKLPIPSPSEQIRIVDEIEKQFTRLDACLAALKRVQGNLKRYRAAVLKVAGEGKLVPTESELAKKEQRKFETGTELLKRVLVERRKNWTGRGKYKEPVVPEPLANFVLPGGWAWGSVQQLSTLVQYGSSTKTNADSTGVPVLRMGNIQDGKFDLDSLKYLPKKHDEFPDLLLKNGDLLFNRTNSAELVGKTAIFKGVPSPCSFASYLIRVHFSEGCLPDYASYWINSVFGRSWITGCVSQQVGQANVNGTKLQSLAVPLPPLSEQKRIVAEVERRLSVVEELDNVVKLNLDRAKSLRQSILQKAFAGELC